jgi:hypothetical protein
MHASRVESRGEGALRQCKYRSNVWDSTYVGRPGGRNARRALLPDHFQGGSLAIEIKESRQTRLIQAWGRPRGTP